MKSRSPAVRYGVAISRSRARVHPASLAGSWPPTARALFPAPSTGGRPQPHATNAAPLRPITVSADMCSLPAMDHPSPYEYQLQIVT
jgi:hypothetical protein